MSGLKTAVFLVGVLNDRLQDSQKKSRDIETRWKKELDDFEATLPEPEERTVEQWEKYVELTGERYYSMAAYSHTFGAANHVMALAEALKEQV